MIVNIKEQKLEFKLFRFFLFIEVLASIITDSVYFKISFQFIVGMYYFINVIFLKIDKHNQRVSCIFLVSVNDEFSI